MKCRWSWSFGVDVVVVRVVVVALLGMVVGHLVKIVVLVVDVELLAAVVPLGWWLVGLRAVGLRMLRGRGGGSNIRRCVRSDQGGGVKGWRCGVGGVWYRCGVWCCL